MSFLSFYYIGVYDCGAPFCLGAPLGSDIVERLSKMLDVVLCKGIRESVKRQVSLLYHTLLTGVIPATLIRPLLVR